ncbi:MAG: ABC transporter permease [Gracilibacteraceae bacterium]|jgi:putative ABC transport system permease protein|nr:ABC transporter permease [Gracilibacteraceae bacterium]
MNVLGTLQLGFIYGILTLGIFITFRVMNMPDLTVDGSFTLGLAVSAALALSGRPVLGLLLGFISGAGAGAVTGLLQTKAGIHSLLAGILTMTGLYSVNLAIMHGSPNVSLLQSGTVFSAIRAAFPAANKDVVILTAIVVLCVLCFAGLAWFFHTGAGLRVRAAGDNAAMVRASSINADHVCILSVALANAFIGLSGAVLAQYQGYADINAGTGIIVVGLASVVIGEVAVKKQTIVAGLLAAVIGAVAYRVLIALALSADFFPAYMLRLVSAVIVAATLAIPRLRAFAQDAKIKKEGRRNVENQ